VTAGDEIRPDMLDRIADLVAAKLAETKRKPADRGMKTSLSADRKRHEMPDDGLAKLIRRARDDLRLTLNDVGLAAGVHPTLVWQLEVGKTSNPKILVLFGLSVALKTPFEEICRAALVDAQTRQQVVEGIDV
jgi:DNA-binding XRE family transcriptional regulator